MEIPALSGSLKRESTVFTNSCQPKSLSVIGFVTELTVGYKSSLSPSLLLPARFSLTGNCNLVVGVVGP